MAKEGRIWRGKTYGRRTTERVTRHDHPSLFSHPDPSPECGKPLPDNALSSVILPSVLGDDSSSVSSSEVDRLQNGQHLLDLLQPHRKLRTPELERGLRLRACGPVEVFFRPDVVDEAFFAVLKTDNRDGAGTVAVFDSGDDVASRSDLTAPLPARQRKVSTVRGR
jgi:hypothetical protein